MKKISKIIIGTHNKGKFKELSFLLSKKIKKISPENLGIKSPKENGKTFKQNSEIKAKYFFSKSKLYSISDDSGLCINCLNGKPGIYSARWAKKNGGFYKAMKKIISLIYIKNNKPRTTKAKFVCSLTFQLSKNKKITRQGVIYGNISNSIKGKNGFGYDSIFIPKNYKLTFGQMNKRKKMIIDHRYLAFKKLKKKINIL
jgi:XTP/dITP diphosphohydrolase